MAPHSAEIDVPSQDQLPLGLPKGATKDVTTTASTGSASRLSGPLQYAGTLDTYDSFDVTAAIGREFPTLQLSEILHDDAKIRDLAVLVSQRGVVFFRNQNISIEDQKFLGQRLGELTGKPETSKVIIMSPLGKGGQPSVNNNQLHRHALSNSKRGISVDENGKLDDEVSVISSEQNRRFYNDHFNYSSKRIASHGWHADITFERIPSDYAILKIVQPSADAGGDTLWASGYEAYDRLSPALQKLAEGLTATHHQPRFVKVKESFGEDLIDGYRGAPENTGLDFKAEHPVIRTNPVTGWKSLFGAAHQVHAGWINDVTERESEILKDYFTQLIVENHDLQVRFRWNKNDLAIWDNRSVFHTATKYVTQPLPVPEDARSNLKNSDYAGKRQGNRVVSLGEKPYFDPNSISRREALAQALA